MTARHIGVRVSCAYESLFAVYSPTDDDLQKLRAAYKLVRSLLRNPKLPQLEEISFLYEHTIFYRGDEPELTDGTSLEFDEDDLIVLEGEAPKLSAKPLSNPASLCATESGIYFRNDYCETHMIPWDVLLSGHFTTADLLKAIHLVHGTGPDPE